MQTEFKNIRKGFGLMYGGEFLMIEFNGEKNE